VAGISTFLAMGGYAGYLWPAYGIAAFVLAALLVLSLRAMRARERELEASELQRRGRRGGRSVRADETQA